MLVYESILTQMYVFLVSFTISDFYHELFVSKIEKIYFAIKKMWIWAKLLSYSVVRYL